VLPPRERPPRAPGTTLRAALLAALAALGGCETRTGGYPVGDDAGPEARSCGWELVTFCPDGTRGSAFDCHPGPCTDSDPTGGGGDEGGCSITPRRLTEAVRTCAELIDDLARASQDAEQDAGTQDAAP
jgi:hypothetical protein